MKFATQIPQALLKVSVAAAVLLLANGCYQQEFLTPQTPEPTPAIETPSETPDPEPAPSPDSIPSEESLSIDVQTQNPPVTPSVPDSNPTQTLPHSPLPPSTYQPPQIDSSSPLDGIWKLQYSVHGIIYQSVLKMEGNQGKMLTRFFNVNAGQPEEVEQTLKIEPSAHGLLLLGSNPVYPGTNTPYPTYSADNFLFTVNPDGSRFAYTCDAANRCSPVEMEYVGASL